MNDLPGGDERDAGWGADDEYEREELSDGDIPACLTSDDELSYRCGSPASAKIAAAPTAVRAGMSASNAASPAGRLLRGSLPEYARGPGCTAPS